LHMAQLMPLPLTVSCSSKIQIGFTFLVPANPGSPGKRAVKRVCVCVFVLELNTRAYKIANYKTRLAQYLQPLPNYGFTFTTDMSLMNSQLLLCSESS